MYKLNKVVSPILAMLLLLSIIFNSFLLFIEQPVQHFNPRMIQLSTNTLTPTRTLTKTITNTITPIPIQVPTLEDAIPPPKGDAIPPPKYDYGCISKDIGTEKEIQCITKEMTFIEQVSHTMFLEGSIDSIQLLVDMLQVVLNDDYYAWNCSITKCSNLDYRVINPLEIPWSEITTNQFQRLTLYILSQPYYPSIENKDLSFAVWNGWGMPLKWGLINSTYPAKVRNYNYTEEAVQLMLDNCVGFDLISGYECISLPTKSTHIYTSQHPIRVINVTYAYSTLNHLLGNGAPVVAFDKIDAGNGNWEYVQFLTDSGAKYAK